VDIETVRLGNSGLQVSRFVFGTMTFAGTKGFESVGSARGEAARRQIDMVLAAGGNAIDTADIYSRGDAEEVVGEALAGRRDQVLLFTKAGFPMGKGVNHAGASRQHLTAALEASLRRLRTDYIDLYFVHRWDGLTPVEETVDTLSGFVRAGKIRYWGVSNYSGWQLAKTVMTARASGLIAPVAQQIYYTAEAREAEYELLPAGADLGVAAMIWSPLGQGVLSGKIGRGQPAPAGSRQAAHWPEPWIADQERLWRVIDALRAVATETGATVAQVALAWLKAQAHVGPIVIGARNETQLQETLAAAKLALTVEQVHRIEVAGRPGPIYPLWHRALNAFDRADPVEAEYLRRHRETLGVA
jgi:aryl-alcohol dehydrogenase-like predicted oxidoreductase